MENVEQSETIVITCYNYFFTRIVFSGHINLSGVTQKPKSVWKIVFSLLHTVLTVCFLYIMSVNNMLLSKTSCLLLHCDSKSTFYVSLQWDYDVEIVSMDKG